MKSLFMFATIVACTISCGFPLFATDKEPAAGETPPGESSPDTGEKNNESVPREFIGFADVSEFRGVIDDPDGYVNLRKEKQVDAPVITKVRAGEPFQFKKKEGEDWCRVKLKSGVSGWMHCSRIKLYFTKDDLPLNQRRALKLMSKRAGKALIITTSPRRRCAATNKR